MSGRLQTCILLASNSLKLILVLPCLMQVLSRISVLGSAFLAILAAGPAVVEQITHLTAFRGFAGTSVLILVGCATDTARKVEAEIISQKYKNIEFYDIDKFSP